MTIGVPKEIMDQERRVAIIPEGVRQITEQGHAVYIEKGAGSGSGFSDYEYAAAGAKITSKEKVWARAQIITKVKQPLREEYVYFRPKLIILTFFHFPANPKLESICKNKGVIAIPYETIRLPNGSRPILGAMSRIAGEIATDVGAHYLRAENGGKGILLRDATVSIIGAAGTAGGRAYEILKPRANSILAIDIIHNPLLGDDFRQSNPENIRGALRKSDLVIGAAVDPNGGAPKLITRDMVAAMPKRSVLVDISVDEGGISETSRATSHSNPIYVDEGVIHYCVPNMPGAVPRSSSRALANSSLEYILAIAGGDDAATRKRA